MQFHGIDVCALNNLIMGASVPVYFLAAAVGAQVGQTAAEHETSSLLYLCATWRWRRRLEVVIV